MTEEQIALAKRAVACRGFRWMAGMLTSHGARYLGFDLWVDRGQRVAVFADPDEGEVPDLTDPATLGCLLALVREAWGDERAHAAYDRGTEWDASHWYVLAGGFEWYCDTEEYGLVMVLEAAP